MKPEDLYALLSDSDMDLAEEKKLRRRVEDTLRKQPSTMLKVAAWLASEGLVRINDLI